MFKRSILVCGIAWALASSLPAAAGSDNGGAQIIVDAKNVPAWIYPSNEGGILLPRTESDPQAQALVALKAYAEAFRMGADDGFTVTTVAEVNDVEGIADLGIDLGEEDEEGPNPAFGGKASDKDEGGEEKVLNVWLQQTYQGLKVKGGEMVVSMSDKGVLSIHGSFYPQIDIKAKDVLNTDTLLSLTKEHMDKQLGASVSPTWLDTEAEVYVDDEGNAHHVRIANVEYSSEQGIENDNLLVDTADGKVVAQFPNILRAQKAVADWRQFDNPYAARCLGAPARNPLSLPVDNGENGPTRLYDTTMDSWSPLPAVASFLNFDFNLWSDHMDDSGQVGSAYKHADLTDLFYRSNFNWNSYDNRGSPLVSHVRFSIYLPAQSMRPAQCQSNNAFWRSAANPLMPNGVERQMYYSPYAPSPAPYGAGFYGETVLDPNVASHELTHGLTEMTSDLEYESESGAMNEASSDIMAEAVEWWNKRGYAFKQGGIDWQIGTLYTTPGGNRNLLLFMARRDDALRYFYNPSLDRYDLSRNVDGTPGTMWNSPTHYSPAVYAERRGGANCVPMGLTTNDNCWVHLNSGIFNHWFFLLSRGGGNPRGDQDVRIGVPPYEYGIGIGKAMRIWYGAVLGTGANRVTSRATFRDLRNATIREAQRLYSIAGTTDALCSPELLGVVDAWNKTGWSDRVDPAMDMVVCNNQFNLLLNGTMENGVTWSASGAQVDGWGSTPSTAIEAPRYGSWAMFNTNAKAQDEMMSAFLGGSGQASTNSVFTNVAIPNQPFRAMRLGFLAGRVKVARQPDVADPSDAMTVEITVPATGVVVYRQTIPSNLLRNGDGGPNRYSILLEPSRVAALRGQTVQIRFSYSENNGIPTKLMVDSVSLVAGL